MNLSNRSRLAIAAVTLGLLAAACGGDDSSSDTTTPAATTAAATATTAAASTATTSAAGGDAVELATTSLGDVLTSGGKTLYIFTPDDSATPTCVDACATAWPPLAGGAAVAGDGIEAEDLTTVARPDGSMQVAYYGWPLYFYANDAAPGDVTGQGVGGKWWVIGADGAPIES
jgi:predicted lipoprotein with Yx(FWY)xxD motif